jgi:hypothetical protein
MIEELVAQVFAARNAAHREHWATTSYAKHQALGAFYDGLPDLIDGIVESYQGQKGLIELDGQFVTPSVQDCCDFLIKQREWIGKHRDEIAKGCTDVANQIDTLLGLYNATIYKLENLK